MAKRIKHSCCWRLEKGPRIGQMCRRPIDGTDRFVGCKDYCLEHTMLDGDRKAREKLKQLETEQ